MTTTPTTTTAASDATLMPKLAEATREVFETMVFTTLTGGEPLSDKPQPEASVMGSVRFLGSLSGTVSFYAADDAAREIACLMLGAAPEEADGQLADAIGEITNMIAGTFRAKMAQAGETLMITTPTVTRGSDFCAQHFHVVSRWLSPFTMNGRTVYVELILQAA
jgi:chemotaxis protein CheX